jgi:HSP20 family molecular chaperone IbpA
LHPFKQFASIFAGKKSGQKQFGVQQKKGLFMDTKKLYLSGAATLLMAGLGARHTNDDASRATTPPASSFTSLQPFLDNFDADDDFNWEKFDEEFAHLHKKLHERAREIEHTMQAHLTSHKALSKSFAINESESKDGKTWVVTLTLPGFKEKETDVTVEPSKEEGTVEVTISKKSEVKENGEQKANKKMISHTRIIRREYSSSSEGNSGYEFKYKDGMIKAKIMLPSTINCSNYDVTVNDEEVVIEFPKTTQQKDSETKTEKQK